MERKRGSNRKKNQTAIDVHSTIIISDKSVNNNGVSSTDAGDMRKPLSDLINFNLVPTQTLRKLSSNSISASQAQSPSRKSQDPKFPLPRLPPNSKPHIVSDSNSRSATSIGSSNFNTAPNTQPKNPNPVPPPPSSSYSSSKSLNPTGDKGVISSHPRVVENLKGPRKDDVSPHTSTISKKTKNQEKATPVLTSSEKAKDKGKAVAAPFYSTPTGNIRDKGKEISVHFKSSNIENTSDKGKAGHVPFTSTLGEKRKDKGKAIAHEELENVGKYTPMLMNSQSSKKPKEKRKADAMVLSCPPRLLGTRNIGNELSQDGEIIASKSWTDPRRKAKKKKCSQQQSVSECSLPEEYVMQQKAYFEEVDAFELPVEEVSTYDSD